MLKTSECWLRVIHVGALALAGHFTEQLSHVHVKDFSRWSHLKFFRYAYETIAWIVQQVRGSFLEFIINILIVISLFHLFVTPWILNEFENVWESVSQPGRSLNYHYLYKCTKEKNVSFSSLVNLPMEFSVIETFILIMEGRFSLVVFPQILLAQQKDRKSVV